MKVIYTLDEAKQVLEGLHSPVNVTIVIEVPSANPPAEQKSFPFMEVYLFMRDYEFQYTENGMCSNKLMAIKDLRAFVQARGFFIGLVEAKNTIEYFC
jgi:ribosomal protein L7/L12